MFNLPACLEYFIIIQDHIIKHKMFAAHTLFFVEKHENAITARPTIAKQPEN